MITLLGILGTVSGVTLSSLLGVNLRHSDLRMWPALHGSWQSYLFWFLFRSLNVSALLLSVIDWQPKTADDMLRLGATVAGAVGGTVYVIACIRLGRDNLYCGKRGLIASGIYAWSRNPQYAIAIPAYVALAVASQATGLTVLVALLVVVFWLMAMNEEPWLEAVYGEVYLRYLQTVPRFYNWRRLRP